MLPDYILGRGVLANYEAVDLIVPSHNRYLCIFVELPLPHLEYGFMVVIPLLYIYQMFLLCSFSTVFIQITFRF